MLNMLFEYIWLLLKWPCYIILSLMIIFYLLVYLHVGYQLLINKQRFKKPKNKHTFKRHPLKDIFWNLPKQISLDIFNKDPDDFPYQGIIIFEGRQGYGKTISMIEYTRFMQNKYPLSKCICNIQYDKRDEALTHWKQLLTYDNDRLGVIVDIDEIQNWFNSKDSKDFPPEMLTTVTTNRKNTRIILGTAQQFYMIAKDIRTQCTEVRSCRTLFGCLTFVLRREPHVESDGIITGYKFKGLYFFAHTPELRNSYDTREMVYRLAEVGFNERPPEVKIDMSQFR